MTTTFIIMLALIFDRYFAEPKRLHPLVFFGRQVEKIERYFNRGAQRKGKGVLSLLIVIVLPTLCIYGLERLFLLLTESLEIDLQWVHSLMIAWVLYLTLGWQSLIQHAHAIQLPLREGDLAKARHALAHIVSRDTQALDEPGIAKAATESVLENGADAIYAAIFWFLIAGLPGAVLYRLVNTLDAMWGYKNKRFLNFGWAAARLDDLMNWLPARLTALSYALAGKGLANKIQAFKCWRAQASLWKSPNAGAVMAAGAGALGVSLGGSAYYQHQYDERGILGVDPASQVGPVTYKIIDEACGLVNRALFLWVVLVASLQWAVFWL